MSQNKIKPLLSICIPTYNRADYLKATLDNITSDQAFGLEIEVIISDNASTDHTRLVAEEFTIKYSNIHYFCNETNVRDGNFILALTRGTGRYRKLSNDTLHYFPGALSKMLKYIRENDSSKPLFFYNNIKFIYKDCQKNTTNSSDFVDSVAFFIGWIANFGLWENDLNCVRSFSKYTKLQFVQVAWTMEIIRKHQSAKLIFSDFYKTVEPMNKGSYNLFKVQISNLFSVLRDYGLKGKSYEIAKYRMFRYQVLPLYYRYIECRLPTGFDLTNSLSTILSEYLFRPYLFPGLLIAKLKGLSYRLKNKKKKLR